MKSKFPFSVLVVTGGSSGIGRAFIRSIFNLDPNVLVCNISRENPEEFSNNSRFFHYTCDLADHTSLSIQVPIILQDIHEKSPHGSIFLLNNSGFGSYGSFQDLDSISQTNMVQVNVTAMVELTSLLLPLMLKRGGHILNVGSLAGFFPTPYMSTYGATKAFVRNWSLALREDLRNTNVSVTALCPGPVHTNFSKRAGFGGGDSDRLPTDFVIQQALLAVKKDLPYLIPGRKSRLLACLQTLIPLTFQARIAKHFIKKRRSQ